MSDSGSAELRLVADAVAGDEEALQQLLITHHKSLAAHIAGRLPRDLRGFLDVDDVLQDAYVTVFRKVTQFEPRGPGAFRAWLTRIAERRLSDVVEAQHRLKRGGAHSPVAGPLDPDHASLIGLLGIVATHSRTPSRSAAEHETVEAVYKALQALPEEQREALVLRFIEGFPVSAIAGRMKRSEGAVHMLCNRGLKGLRQRLGELSGFLSRLP